MTKELASEEITPETKPAEPHKKFIKSPGLSSISGTRISLNKPPPTPAGIEKEKAVEVAAIEVLELDNPTLSVNNEELIAAEPEEKFDKEPEVFSIAKIWIKYAEDAYQLGKKSSSSAMKVVSPTMENSVILIEVKNDQQREAIEAIRIDFLNLIRKIGAPEDSRFEFLINPDKNENLRPYTDKEKIDYMASKNVFLQKLIKELNLKV